MKLTVGGKEHEVEIVARDGEARAVVVNGRPYVVTIRGGRSLVEPGRAKAREATPPAAGPVTLP